MEESVLLLLVTFYNHIPHLIEKVLFYLSLKDLKRLSKVSKDIKTCVEQIYDKRRLQIENIFKAKGILHGFEDADQQWKTLWCASQYGDFDLVSVLLGLGVDVEIVESSFGFTPLHNAAKFGHVDIVEILLEDGNAKLEGKTKAGDNPNTDRTALHLACQYGQVNLVNYLISQGANVHATDCMGQTPLWFASFNGHVEVIKLLIEYGANVDYARVDGQTLLHAATQGTRIETVLYLVENLHVDINAKDFNGNTALHIASRTLYTKIAVYLISKRTNVEEENKHGKSPLSWATFYRNVEAMKILMIYGANVEHIDSDGNRPIHTAAQNGDLAAMKLLLEGSEADVNAPGHANETALHVASKRGHLRMVQYLISKKAFVNALNSYKQNPLSCATSGGHVEVMRFLYSKGANKKQFDINGMGLVHIAAENGHLKAIQFLRKELRLDVHEFTKSYESVRTNGILLAARNRHSKTANYLERLETSRCRKIIS